MSAMRGYVRRRYFEYIECADIQTAAGSVQFNYHQHSEAKTVKKNLLVQ